jgi:arylamine N-acetyltransferase
VEAVIASPLAPPEPSSPTLGLFREHFGLTQAAERRQLLAGVCRAFTRLPYENLTKILKDAESTNVEEARRGPQEVVAEHVALGSGGTCFSLTAALLHLVRALGFDAEPLLADRRYGPNTHCALLVWLDGAPHLVDPGYLLADPLPLPVDSEVRVRTAFNEVVLRPRDGGARLDLFTRQQGGATYRLTFRAQPADAGEFLRAWDASFDWDMMRYPVLTRVEGSRQVYLQANRLQVRGHEILERREIAPDGLGPWITSEFGIEPRLVARALEVLRQRGELRG